jgi:ATP-dependent Clp protease ATP-binding subunit ClpA
MSGLGFGAQGSQGTETERYEQAKGKVMDALKEHFRPEFLNRLDEIIIFNILSPEHVRNIVRMQTDLLASRLEEKHISLTVTDAALDALAKEGYNPQYGARPLKRVIQNRIMTPIANMMVARGVLEGGSVKVDFNPKGGADGRGEFTFDVRKGPERERSVRARAKAEVR